MIKVKGNMTISKVYASRNILLDILASRGFDVSEYNDYSISHVGSMMEHNQLDLLLSTASGKKIFVKYCLEGRPNLDKIVDDFFPSILNTSDDLMLIVKDDLNDSATEFLEHLWSSSGKFLIVVSMKRLQYNILKHVLVPAHTILQPDERAALLAEYRIKPQQLPEISRFDPVATLLGMRPGDVCRIERKSKTSMHSKYYRVCV
jgi:DNA-directed RNA polymerase subunit H (RpoH/RPB5)